MITFLLTPLVGSAAALAVAPLCQRDCTPIYGAGLGAGALFVAVRVLG